MRRALIGLIPLGFASTATAATIAARRAETPSGIEQERGGPASARVARFLHALAAAEPVVCELVADPIGNYWFNNHEYGIGQLADTRMPVRAEKDSVSRHITDPAAIRMLSARLGTED